MPWMTIPIATAIAGVAGAGATVYGTTKSAGAAKQASKVQSDATRRAQDIEQVNETRRQQEFDRVEAEKKAQWDAEQKQLEEDRRIAAEDRARKQQYEDEDRNLYYAKEARRAPYRAASDAALRSAAASIGLDLGTLPTRVDVPYRPGVATTASSTAARQPASALSMADAVQYDDSGVPAADPYILELSGARPMSDEVQRYRSKPRYA